MDDYSGPLVQAKIYLREAEECFKRKDYQAGVMLLRMVEKQVQAAIEWVK